MRQHCSTSTASGSFRHISSNKDRRPTSKHIEQYALQVPLVHLSSMPVLAAISLQSATAKCCMLQDAAFAVSTSRSPGSWFGCSSSRSFWSLDCAASSLPPEEPPSLREVGWQVHQDDDLKTWSVQLRYCDCVAGTCWDSGSLQSRKDAVDLHASACENDRALLLWLLNNAAWV